MVLSAPIATGWWHTNKLKRYYDEESGREFYYNSFSNESTFDRPAAFVEPEADDASSYSAQAGASSSTALVATTTTTTTGNRRGPVEKGEAHWAKYWDDNAQLEFYFNSATNESTYDRPGNFVTPRDPEGGGKKDAFY